MIGPARKRDVTIANRHPAMPRSRLGALPMTAAERQARRRARLRCHQPDTAATPTPRRRPRPQRWAAAVAALLALLAEKSFEQIGLGEIAARVASSLFQ